MHDNSIRLTAGVFAALLVFSSSVRADSEPTAAEAVGFVATAEANLARESEYLNRAGWVQATYITDDTSWLFAKANAESTDIGVRYAKEASRFDHVKVDDVTRGRITGVGHYRGETRCRLFDREIYRQWPGSDSRRHGRSHANIPRPERDQGAVGRVEGGVFSANEIRLRTSG